MKSTVCTSAALIGASEVSKRSGVGDVAMGKGRNLTPGTIQAGILVVALGLRAVWNDACIASGVAASR